MANIPKHIEKQALHWYVRMQSPEFSRQEYASFLLWLESSPKHQAAFIRVEAAWQAGVAVRDISTKKTRITHPQIFSLATAAILALAFVLHFFSSSSNKVDTQHYATLIDEQKVIELPDRSVMTMHSATNVTVRLSPKRREVKLMQGRIYLKVASDKRKPFFVLTSKGDVRVIGTKFSVAQLTDDVRVTVVEGLVGIVTSGKIEEPDADPLIVLAENQEILLSAALAGEDATSVDAARELAWIDGRLTFDGVPLAEVVASLNRHLPIPIFIVSPELEQKKIVGAISVKDSRSAAASLAGLTGATVTKDTVNAKFILEKTR